MQNIIDAIDEEQFSCITLLTKDFDCVNHEILLSKLEEYVIREKDFNLFIQKIGIKVILSVQGPISGT